MESYGILASNGGEQRGTRENIGCPNRRKSGEKSPLERCGPNYLHDVQSAKGAN